MAEFVRICSQSELPKAGGLREVEIAGRILCIANLEGAICVLDGVCPHEGGPLAEGTIEDGRVVCPWHAFAFDLRTGVAADDPDLKAKVYEAKVENGELSARLSTDLERPTSL